MPNPARLGLIERRYVALDLSRLRSQVAPAQQWEIGRSATSCSCRGLWRLHAPGTTDQAHCAAWSAGVDCQFIVCAEGSSRPAAAASDEGSSASCITAARRFCGSLRPSRPHRRPGGGVSAFAALSVLQGRGAQGTPQRPRCRRPPYAPRLDRSETDVRLTQRLGESLAPPPTAPPGPVSMVTLPGNPHKALLDSTILAINERRLAFLSRRCRLKTPTAPHVGTRILGQFCDAYQSSKFSAVPRPTLVCAFEEPLRRQAATC